MSNVIDYKEYMSCDIKVYVDVNEDRMKDGKVVPLSFVWEDGRRYEIDRILDVRPAASLKAGGAGMRYTVRVRNRETYMFLEEDSGAVKWFMERKL
jgi:hypothetical protein